MKQKHKDKITDEQIIDAYDRKLTLHIAATELSMTVVTLWRRAKKLGLYWNEIPRTSSKKIPLDKILSGDHPDYQTFKLKNRLILEGYKENVCELCGISEWNGKKLSMQLDHIDGNCHNHKMDNLRLICPNCHSQTDTYCGKNKD